MPRVSNPADWVIDRLRDRVPFFSIRFNDGEMQMMYRSVPEGKVLGTDANPCRANYELGDAMGNTLYDISKSPDRENVLIGCSWGTDRADDLGRGPFDRDVKAMNLEGANWTDEHWPLDGVTDGSTVRMIEQLAEGPQPVLLVTCPKLAQAARCFGPCAYLTVSPEDSWGDREEVYEACRGFAEPGAVFVWAAGCGLKPTAWRLWREFPRSSHLDIGHLFNGAFGLRDYGWLQRQDGPWYRPYFGAGGFTDWVRRAVTTGGVK